MCKVTNRTLFSKQAPSEQDNDHFVTLKRPLNYNPFSKRIPTSTILLLSLDKTAMVATVTEIRKQTKNNYEKIDVIIL